MRSSLSVLAALAALALSGVALAETHSVVLPGDAVVLLEGADGQRHLEVLSVRLQPRGFPDDIGRGLDLFKVAVDGEHQQVFALSDADGGSLYRFDRSLEQTFSSQKKGWKQQEYRDIVATPRAMVLLSGRNGGRLVRMDAGLRRVKWGPTDLGGRTVAASPDGTSYYVGDEASGGTLYRFNADLDEASKTGGPDAGLRNLDVVGLAALDDGRIAVASKRDGGRVMVFDSALQPLPGVPGGGGEGLEPLAIAADGGGVLVASGTDGGRVLRLNGEGERVAASVPLPGLVSVHVNGLDGTVVAVAGGGRRVVRLSGDLQTVMSEREFSGGKVVSLAMAPPPPLPQLVTPHASWTNTLRPGGEPAGELAVSGDGGAAFDILVPEGATPQEDKAAVDLAYWLGAATGTRPVIRGDDGPTAGDRPFISVGRTRQAAAADDVSADAETGAEGYRIAMHGGNLYLTGGDRRGPIYAVYALLEEDLGFRWFDRTTVMMPDGGEGELVLRPVARSAEPPLERRDPHYTDAFNTDWSLRNRTNGPRSPVPAAWGGYARTVPSFVHTYNYLLPPAEYFKPHPEWFALLNGKRLPKQLCPMHPDGRATIIARVRQMLADTPEATYIDISPNDFPDFCECELCTPVIKREGTAMGPLLSLTNAVAEAIADEHPDVLVTTLAYLTTVEPPRRMRPHPNVRVVYATNNHWMTICRPVTDNKVILDHVAAWRRIRVPLHIWHYPIQYGQYVRPIPNMAVMTEDLRYFIGQGATGFMYQANHSHSLGVDRAKQRCWVWSKQMWDPDRDTRDLIRDFTYGYYGEAGDEMMAYHEMLWDMAARLQDSEYFQDPWKSQQPIFQPQFVDAAMPHLDAALAAAAGNEALTGRVQLARLPVLYVKGELGPGDDLKGYLDAVDEVEQTAKANGVRFLKKGLAAAPDRDELIQTWRNLAVVKPEMLDIETVGPAWKLKADPDDAGLDAGWAKRGLDDADWLDVEVKNGSFWEKTGMPDYDGHGWYRTTLNVPAKLMKRKHLYLLFGAADEYAEVFLDGERVIDHSYAATLLPPDASWNMPFAADLHEKVRAGRPYQLAVRVHDSQAAGGLWKPVCLVGSDQALPAETLQAFVEKAGKGE